jgi:hypothetical protein
MKSLKEYVEVATRDYGVPLLLQRLSDPHLIEGARRLRQDTAVQGGASHEHSLRLDQDDALQMRTYAHLDKSGDLPEDVFASAPASRITLVFAACTRFPVVCMMKTSVAEPEKWMSELTLISVPKV